MSDEEVVIRIAGENKIRPATEEAKAAVRDLANSVKESNNETKDATRSTDLFGYSWKQVAVGAAVGAGAMVAVGFAQMAASAMATADEMVNLRTKTGLSLEELQRLSYVAKLGGGNLSEYANAVYQMEINLAKGGTATDKAQAAVQRMGISWSEFIALSPDQKLQTIMAHLEGMTTEGERNATMQAIFGRSIDSVLVGLIQHYDRAREAAVVMSDGSVEALARYKGEIDELKAKWSNFQLVFMGGIAEQINAVSNLSGEQLAYYMQLRLTGGPADEYLRRLREQKAAAEQLTPAMKAYIGKVLETQGAQVVLSKEFENSGMFIGASRDLVRAYIQEVAKAPPVQRSLQEELAKAREELAALTPETKANIEAGLAMGRSTKLVAEEVGKTEAAVRLYKERLDDQEREQRKANDAAEKHAEMLYRVQQASVAVSDAKKAEVLQLKAQLLSESLIAEKLGLTIEQVKQVIAAEKARVDAAEAGDKVLTAVEERRLKASQELREAEQARGLERMKLEGELHDALVQYDQDQSLRVLTGLARELQAIQISEDAAIAAARRKYGTNVDLADQEIARIKEHHQQQRDLATGTADTIVQRMTEQGYQTKAMLRESADVARQEYEEMRKNGSYSIDELNRKRDEWLQKELLAAGAMGGAWAKAFAGLPAVILGALQGGGDVARAAGAHLGTSLASDLAKNAAEDLIKSGHPKLAGAVMSFAGPLGSLAGDLFGAAFSKIVGGFFGSAGRDAVKEFAANMGGFDALRAKLLPLGDEGERLWKNLTQGVGKNNPEQAKKAIDAITEALERSDAALQKYGISWVDMSGAARDAALADIVKQLTQESADLTRAGVAQDTIIRKQADAYNELLGQALRAGEEIPPALLPTIQRMLELGEITDENRRLLLGLTDDGKPSLAQMEEAMRTLGLEASDVGERFGNLKFEEDANKYYAALQLLVDGGGDMKHMVGAMSQEIRDFINEGVRMGREFPAEMRPVLEAMQEQGLLTDENGEKLKDLSAVKFSESLEQSTQRMIDKLQDLIDAILGVPSALNGIPDSFDFDVNLHARRSGEWPSVEDSDAPTFASGGMAYGPLLAQIEPGRKELIGDVSFMTEAITGALDRLGMRQSGLGAPVAAGASGATVLQPIQFYLGTEKIDERIIDVTNRGLQGQQIQVPATAIAGRTRF